MDMTGFELLSPAFDTALPAAARKSSVDESKMPRLPQRELDRCRPLEDDERAIRSCV
jgi:hypothetical protein